MGKAAIWLFIFFLFSFICWFSHSAVSKDWIQVFVIPWPIVHQAPLSMEFSRQVYWSGLPCPPPGKLPNPPVLQVGALLSEPSGKPKVKRTQKKSHRHCMVICCWSDPLQLSESWQSHYIWEVCLANRWDGLKLATPAASIGKQNGPNSFLQQCPTACHTTNASKAEQIEMQSFASSSIIT